MAVSALFHHNVLLLTRMIQPSDEFKKHFREGMFDKPNTAGFLHVCHYLLTIYDPKRFKKLIEWPVICKKTEAKYRNNVKDFLGIIVAENSDINFPSILMSHLVLAGGNKFTVIMWKLSQVVVRKYITRETSYNVVFAPQKGIKKNLATKLLQETNVKIRSNILRHHKSLSAIKDTAKIALKEEKEILNSIREKIFEQEQLLTTVMNEAPVHPSIKKSLVDINNEEVIQMWKKNINNGVNHIRKKNTILKDIEQLSCKVNNVISNNSDAKIFDGKQLQKVDCFEMSELFPPDKQCLLFQLYKDDKLVIHNFILLFSCLLTRLHQQLKVTGLEDLSECLLQIDASCKDVKEASNIIETYLTDVTKMTSETQDILCQKSLESQDDARLPIMNNALLMLSPLLKIDTNCSVDENDFQKRLPLTPVEVPYKSLFSRYERLKENHASHGSKLRENLLISRINFDDTVSSINSEKLSVNTHTVSMRKSLLSFKQAEKYSRLFSMRIKENNASAANSSIMSIPCSSKANSTAIVNTIEEMHDGSEHSVNISSRSICNISIEFATPEKVTVRKENKSDNTSEMEDVVNSLPRKPNVLDIYETTEVEITSRYENGIVKTEQAIQRRRSIGDLIERYKKVLENSNRTPSPKLSFVKCEHEI